LVCEECSSSQYQIVAFPGKVGEFILIGGMVYEWIFDLNLVEATQIYMQKLKNKKKNIYSLEKLITKQA